MTVSVTILFEFEKNLRCHFYSFFRVMALLKGVLNYSVYFSTVSLDVVWNIYSEWLNLKRMIVKSRISVNILS